MKQEWRIAALTLFRGGTNDSLGLTVRPAAGRRTAGAVASPHRNWGFNGRCTVHDCSRLHDTGPPGFCSVPRNGPNDFQLFPRDSAPIIVRGEDGTPVHVSVSSAAGTVSAIAAVVSVHLDTNGVDVEARDRPFFTPVRRP